MSQLLSHLHALRSGISDAQNVLESGDIPEHLAQHFACDCTERTWLQRSGNNSQVQELTRSVLQLKRKWIEGDVSIADARRVMEVLQHTEPQSPEPPSGLSNAWKLIRAAWEVVGMASVFLSPEDIASMTNTSQLEGTVTYLLWKGELQLQQLWGDKPLWEDEKEWQRSHLADLLEEYLHEQAELLHILHHRQKQLEEELDAHKEEWEDPLFNL
ncbi:MAG: hypothetical protein EP343_34090 [Deltaproteobacteria bacterium]|nr:MAG: hypothetical protein EP343_34090 [Deltaproteobacteria bacterium]